MSVNERFFKVRAKGGSEAIIVSTVDLFVQAETGAFSGHKCNKRGESMQFKKTKGVAYHGTTTLEVFHGRPETIRKWVKMELFLSHKYGELVTRSEFIEELEERIAGLESRGECASLFKIQLKTARGGLR